MSILVQLLKDDPVFEPEDIATMSKALDEICKALKLDGDTTAREVVATRIIELARRGERSAIRLRERVLAEANGDIGEQSGTSVERTKSHANE